MNDHMIYELAKQRQAELVDEVRRTRRIRSRDYRGSRSSRTATIRQRFAVVTRVVTNRTRTVAAA
jgi:hypothetical protein